MTKDNQNIFKADNKPTWKENGGYLLFYKIHNFFINPYKKEKEEIDILKYADSLLNSAPELTDETIKLSKQLTYMHRVVENLSNHLVYPKERLLH